ncbi:MAG: hypothetical protein IJE43_09880 [Alphaproteobacteria bacterium]|nr:hypothetical protein [Alphaproteobacteria bacterium]
MKDDKSLRGAIDDMYKYQFNGVLKRFKDLAYEEITQLKNGIKLRPLYRDSILILAKAFDINLEERNFQPYITDYSEKEVLLKDFPKNEQCSNILECFRAYENFAKHQSIVNR